MRKGKLMGRVSSGRRHPLEILFHPSAVAIVGVSKNPESQGNMYLRQFLEFPFQGSVYPVSIEEREIYEVPCYRKIGEIPGPVDHVISCVPHHQVSSLVEDCVQKGVRSLHLYTARMAETQLGERVGLERQIVKRAREGGVRVIGPNCMGFYCPKTGLTFRFSLPKEPGHVAFASQSGGNAADLEYQGAGRGLRFSKIISFGNASDLNESDFLDYLLADPETKVIGMYLEGVKDGRRLVELLSHSEGKKPVILYKAGRTKAGSRAVLSHTASMSGEEAFWDAICRQYGVIRVHSMTEMADALLAFQFLRPSKGRRVLAMGGGGGGSVAAADVLELEGFQVPPLPLEMKEEIRTFAQDVWSLISNPMDSSVMGAVETLTRCYQMGVKWGGVDLLIGNTSAIWLFDTPEVVKRHEMIVHFLLHLAKSTDKPMAIVANSGDSSTKWRVEGFLRAQEQCRDAGVPFYPSIERAARALSHFTHYYQRTLKERIAGAP